MATGGEYELGYEDDRFEFVVSQRFHCPICFMVLKDPVMCKNQHYGCSACMKRHLENSKSCPTCLEYLSVDTLSEAPRIVTDYLSELNIKCDYHPRGCPEIVQLDQLKRHVENCGFAPVPCSNSGCNVLVNLSDKVQNETEECEFRRSDSRDCGQLMKEVREMKEQMLASQNLTKEEMKAELRTEVKGMKEEVKGNMKVMKEAIAVEMKWEMREVRSEIKGMENEMKAELSEVKGMKEELRSEVKGMKEEMKGDVKVMKEEIAVEVKGEMREVRNEIKGMENEMKAELKSEVKGMKVEMKGDVKVMKEEIAVEVKGEMREVRNEIKGMGNETKAELENQVKGMKEEIKEEMKGNIKEMKDEIQGEIKGEMREVRNEMKEEMKGNIKEIKEEIQGEIKGEMRDVRNEMKEEMKGMKGEFKVEMRAEMNKMKDEIKGMLMSAMQSDRAFTSLDRKTNIVVAGGEITESGEIVKRKSVEVFKWPTQSWKKLNPMSISRAAHSSFVYEGHMTVVGGNSYGGYTDSAESLNVADPAATWKDAGFKLPVKCYGHKVVTNNDQLIMSGGKVKPTEGGQPESSDRVCEIQLVPPYASNILRKLPQSRYHHGMELFDKKLFIFGGHDGKKATNNVVQYDLIKKECKEMLPLPNAVFLIATVLWRNNVLVLGGKDANNVSVNTVVQYDVITGRSTMLPCMKQKRRGCAAVLTGNVVVVMGGRDEKNEYLKSVECFDLERQVWQDLPDMTEARTCATAVAI